MNIIEKENNNTIKVCEINNGEVFECAGKYYMKVFTTLSNLNAVNIETGDLEFFESNTDAVKINAVVKFIEDDAADNSKNVESRESQDSDTLEKFDSEIRRMECYN